jgi:4-aminobutyrate aminotransferase
MWAFDEVPVPWIQPPLPGPRARALLERDAVYVSPSYTRIYPLVVARGSGAVIEDVDGNRFLDMTAGIAVTATGHCHPEVVAAIQDQAAKLLHMSGTDFYYAPEIDFAQRLAEAMPGPSSNRVFFTNSGAEALEAALKLARIHTGRSRVIAFLGAFHGRTYGAMSLSGSKLVHRRGFSPLVPDIHHVPFPHECANADGHGLRAGDCRVVQDIEELMHRVAPPDEVAAIFLEPIQGEGGYYVTPKCCLPALRELCDRHGILLVLDEVQCGIGRTGKTFAFEHWGIEPDIVCLAKGIASGMPLGAIVAKSEVMDWPSGSHASTFGGNPVSCRAALATLDLLQREYLANATARGEQLHNGLIDLCDRVDQLRDPRGLGLMRAVDVVNADSGEPDPILRDELIQTAFHRGLLLLGCGDSALRFCPPLCITAEQVDMALHILGTVIAGAVAEKVAV